MKKSVIMGMDAVIVFITMFFVLMTALDLVGASVVKGYSANAVLVSAIGLAVLMPIHYIISLLGGDYDRFGE